MIFFMRWDRFRRFHLSACLLLSLVPVFAGTARAEAARVVFATGSAAVLAADGVSRKAERGTVIDAGETVDTGDGRVQLRFGDGSSVSLQPGTQFRVEEFRFAEQSGKASNDDRIVMRFLKGALRAVSGLIGREKREQYRMDTRVGTIGIRGTEYGASFGDIGLVVAVYAGLVEVCNAAGCAQAGPGQSLLAGDDGARPKVLPGDGGATMLPGAGAVPDIPAPAQTNVPAVQAPAPVPATMPATMPANQNYPYAPMRGLTQ